MCNIVYNTAAPVRDRHSFEVQRGKGSFVVEQLSLRCRLEEEEEERC